MDAFSLNGSICTNIFFYPGHSFNVNPDPGPIRRHRRSPAAANAFALGPWRRCAGAAWRESPWGPGPWPFGPGPLHDCGQAASASLSVKWDCHGRACDKLFSCSAVWGIVHTHWTKLFSFFDIRKNRRLPFEREWRGHLCICVVACCSFPEFSRFVRL